ncbi:uncharacterized protein LOC143554732 [Bidens hawaiensis]|uniref:uncharacterized protein LOC143554732 n=1 Tax=Bidens hawaiensis TaxID=980011 RepID=UPI00404A597B
MAVVVRYVDKLGVVKESYIGVAQVKDTCSSTLKQAIVSLLASNQLSMDQIIQKCEIKTGKGLNQEVSLVRAGDTRWGSHHRTIISLLRLFPEVVDVLRYIQKEGDATEQRTHAKEFGNRFNEVTTTLLENMPGLNPCDRFSKFDTSKIIAFSEMYEKDFTTKERGCLLGELNVFYHSVKEDERFAKLDGISDLARLMLIKTDLRNRMSDDYLNNALICAVERETFNKVTEDDVMARFQAIKCRRGEIIY